MVAMAVKYRLRVERQAQKMAGSQGEKRPAVDETLRITRFGLHGHRKYRDRLPETVLRAQVVPATCH